MSTGTVRVLKSASESGQEKSKAKHVYTIQIQGAQYNSRERDKGRTQHVPPRHVPELCSANRNDTSYTLMSQDLGHGYGSEILQSNSKGFPRDPRNIPKVVST